MACLSLSNVSSLTQSPCWHKQVTVVSCFVIALLFVGLAISSHFASWGIAGIVSFSMASLVFFAVFIIASICSSAKIAGGALPQPPETSDDAGESQHERRFQYIPDAGNSITFIYA